MPDAAHDVFASAFREARPGVAIVGAGAVARALALRLADRGYPVLGVVSRTLGPAEALARQVGAPVASDHLGDLPAAAGLVLLCVPDSELPDLAETLTGVRRPWGQTVVAHTSGAMPAAVLDPLAAEGATALAFHPLQALTRRADAHALDGAYVGVEGEPQAV
ncbi:MAG TPA: NAD(P)-binding domain-containing protein, partial [Rubricoccaceae bacterium]